MNIAFPYQFDARGRTAEAAHDRHVRQMVEQVLFTNPGERVNLPTFGCGLLQLVFAPGGDALAAAAQAAVQGALQQWLGDVIQVESVEVSHQDSTLSVTVRYTVRRTQSTQVVQFSRPGLQP
jgi:hypothetical protein